MRIISSNLHNGLSFSVAPFTMGARFVVPGVGRWAAVLASPGAGSWVKAETPITAVDAISTVSSRVHGMAVKYIVRHGSVRYLGEFEPAENAVYSRGQAVVVRSERGLETGQVLCET